MNLSARNHNGHLIRRPYEVRKEKRDAIKIRKHRKIRKVTRIITINLII